MAECGTTTKYKCGCRCDACKLSAKQYRDRNADRAKAYRKAVKPWVRYAEKNPDKVKASQAKYRSNKRDIIRVKGRYRTRYLIYGLTEDTARELFELQNGECAICPYKFKDYDDHWTYRDHCHTTGKLRGFLCSACNTLLGKLEKRNLDVQRFVDYIANPPAKKVLK